MPEYSQFEQIKWGFVSLLKYGDIGHWVDWWLLQPVLVYRDHLQHGGCGGQVPVINIRGSVRPSLGERELDGLDLFIQDGDQLLFSIIDMFFTVFGDGWS
jgi:hypothetical protein